MYLHYLEWEPSVFWCLIYIISHICFSIMCEFLDACFFFFFFYRKPLGSSRFSLQKRWLQPFALAQSLCRSDVCVGLYFKVGHCWLWFTVVATRHMKCFPSAMQEIPIEVDDAGQEFLKSCWDLNPESICWIWNKAQIMQIVGSLSMGVGDSGECFWLLSGLGKSLLPG